MTRHEKARTVAERVAGRIREVVPVGLGSWGPVWGLIATPSDAFMDRLAEWEATDSPLTRHRLATASTDLVAAWAEAARQWQEAGRPTLNEADEVEIETGELVS